MPHRTKRGHHLGWHPPLPHLHRRKFSACHPSRFATATETDDGGPIDLSVGFPLPVLDQGQIGSCSTNSLSEIITYDQKKNGLAIFQPSRLFLYYNVRQIEGTTDQDAGANNDDLATSLSQFGFCDESLWPYDPSQFAVKPPDAAYDVALLHKPPTPTSVGQTLAEMRAVLLLGYPILVGFTVYSSFDTEATEATGIIPMPSDSDTVEGGHDVVCVGADSEFFWCRNSWSDQWGCVAPSGGSRGYFKIPIPYLTNPDLAGDFKTIETLQ